MGIGSHQSSRMKNEEWLTPPNIINAVSPFDLDPCAPIDRQWETAYHHMTILDDWLSKEWFGKVWMNPPYWKETGKWLKKLADHGNGIALLFARTETKMFFDHVWNKATAVLFIEWRLFFHYVDGTKAKANAWAPSVLIAYGDEMAFRLEHCGIKGKFIRLK